MTGLRNEGTLAGTKPFVRLLAALSAFALLFALLPPPGVSAETVYSGVSVTAVGGAGAPGGKVKVEVSLTPGTEAEVDDGIFGYSIQLAYDTGILHLPDTDRIEDQALSDTFTPTIPAPGEVKVEAEMFGDDFFITEEQAVFTIEFDIAPSATSGTTMVTIGDVTTTLDTPLEVDPDNKTDAEVSINEAPVAYDVVADGIAVEGQTLVGGYEVSDAEGDAEGSAAYRWYAADDTLGTGIQPIDGATDGSLALTGALRGKYVTFEVTPAALTGTAVGQPVKSAPVGPVAPAAADTATVAVGSASGQAGQTIDVPVVLSEASAAVASYGIRIEFDAAALEVVAIDGDSGDTFSGHFDNSAGWVGGAWADADGGDTPVEAEETLFTVKFKIKTGTAASVRTLSVDTSPDAFILTDKWGFELDNSSEAGQVAITAAPGPVTTPVAPVTATESPQPEKIIVNVENTGGGGGQVVSTAVIERSVKPDGTKKDAVTFGAEDARKAVDSIAAAGSKSASIVIPDTKDEVSEIEVKVPKDAGKLVADAGIDLGISTANGKVIVPNASLVGFEEDLYFHFVPLKKEEEKRGAEERANKDTIVRLVAGDTRATVVGRPMTIETNMQNRPVTLVMPLGDALLSDAELASLGVYIEHSDGTKELVRGTIVPYGPNGELGVQFEVGKFSTFTLLVVDGLGEKAAHAAYVNGYADGTFRPDNGITRAEMAALLSRVITSGISAPAIAYSDVAADHWADEEIAAVTTMGLMKGNPNGTFAPRRYVTRAEMAKLIHTLLGGAGAPGPGFSDIAGHWAEEAILLAQGHGLMVGDREGRFHPGDMLTRAEAVATLNRLLGTSGSVSGLTESPWLDVPVDHWAFGDIVEASVGHEFDPTADGEVWTKRD